jgi:apolipoprotein N-acyltransferase
MSKRFGRAQPWYLGTLYLAGFTALLLLVPFPIAGPVAPWRTACTWVALAPLFYSLLNEHNLLRLGYLRRCLLSSYFTGILWYAGNCYWVYQTMLHYGGMPAAGAFGILVLFSLYLGLYFAAFGLLLGLLRKGLRDPWKVLALAPVLWVAIDLANARITYLPWDQLGYSQVDNYTLTRLAPYTGVYGITFVLVAVNAWLVAGLLVRSARRRLWIGVSGLGLAMLLQSGQLLAPPVGATTDTAVLVQPNLSVDESNDWVGPVWDAKIRDYLQLSERTCAGFIAGIPETSSQRIYPDCSKMNPQATLVAWPESPSPFRENDPRFHEAVKELARATHSAAIVGDTAVGVSDNSSVNAGRIEVYNSASVFDSSGEKIGRYDKIHLVPFGEYIPYRNLFFFARSLTQQVGDTGRGKSREVFHLNGHTYGIMICYEAIFADEIRQLSRMGAQVLVIISDDGWYGDTSAPWQILNMGRMRAIENRRWMLRDGNNGVTAAIDPYGRVTQSIDRHIVSSLAARYGYRNDVTFYTEHGDLFAWLCAIIALVALVWASTTIIRKSRAQPEILHTTYKIK